MPRVFSTPLKVIIIVIAMPFAAIAALLSWVFNLKSKLSASEVASYLRDFISGEGGDWDWDDFTSVPIADPQLEEIRRRAAAIDLPATDQGIATLNRLLAEAERMAKSELD